MNYEHLTVVQIYSENLPLVNCTMDKIQTATATRDENKYLEILS